MLLRNLRPPKRSLGSQKKWQKNRSEFGGGGGRGIEIAVLPHFQNRNVFRTSSCPSSCCPFIFLQDDETDFENESRKQVLLWHPIQVYPQKWPDQQEDEQDARKEVSEADKCGEALSASTSCSKLLSVRKAQKSVTVSEGAIQTLSWVRSWARPGPIPGPKGSRPDSPCALFSSISGPSRSRGGGHPGPSWSRPAPERSFQDRATDFSATSESDTI